MTPALEASIQTFHDRVEMMVLAFTHKHRRRPRLVLAQRMERGWSAAYVSTNLFEEDPSVAPELAELAGHADSAWRRWTTLEPDAVVLNMRILAPDTISVTITPRTDELERAIAGEVLRELDALAAKD